MTVPGVESHELPKRLQDVITPIKDLATVHQLKQSVMQLPVVQQASQDLTQFVPDNSVSAYRMDLSWAGVSKLESVTVVRIGLRGATGQKGALTVVFEDQNSSAQWDVPLDWQSVTTLNTRALQDLEFQKLMGVTTAMERYLDFEHIGGLRSITYMSDNSSSRVANVLLIPILTAPQGTVIGHLIYTDSEKGAKAAVMANGILSGYARGKLVQHPMDECLVSWFDCVMNCICGATVGSCVIAISGCIGACCSCANLVSCIPCAGCAAGAIYCMLSCA